MRARFAFVGLAAMVAACSGAVAPSADSDSLAGAAAAPLANGGFETGTLSSWTVVTSNVSITTNSHTGAFAAQVGSTSAFAGDSTLTQTIAIPSTGAPALSFWFRGSCPDSIAYDQQRAEVRNLHGKALVKVLNACETGDWRRVTTDLTPWRGQTVVLWFSDHDDGYAADPTYFLLDDVSVGDLDNTAPSVTVSAPSAGATVNGQITLAAAATDNVGAVRIEVDLDGAPLAAANAASISMPFDTRTVADGAHTLSARASDASGNVGISAPVAITVRNASPQELVRDGSFGGGAAAWVFDGTIAPQVVPNVHNGASALQLGGSTGTTGKPGDSIAYQFVTIPAAATQATLTFSTYLGGTGAPSFATAQLRDQSGTLLKTFFTRSDAPGAWFQSSFDLSAYAGSNLQLYFQVHDDGSNSLDPTQMWIDDVSLVVSPDGVGSTAPCQGTANIIVFDGSTGSSGLNYPGDYIHPGAATITNGTWSLAGSSLSPIGSSFSLQMTPADSSQGLWWTFDFGSNQLGAPLAVSVYESAERAPFASAGHPGIDISGDGRGCNQDAGRFQIFDLEHDASGKVIGLRATFEQHCEAMASVLRGCISYHQ
jgi:hypothetical protein